ncbi:hypothetical protein OG562_29185 [Streptomyces sp. NBC_01275]|uniref:hypothetical protein n=1 Tax=Streptomyces sp. NBC_01275 TaxID=2903807 RepID=UPI002259D0B5|nr:hypothetical protein [Streptomyces sp. NBC_01275]MCX4764974.1 hypothetical protein [Streptomyces sp. NBC_01275]
MTTLAVALISVGGTLGGTLGGAVLGQRARRVEMVEQNQRAERERQQERTEHALQTKQDLYAQLNTAARAYRVAARDAVEAAERGESVDPAHLDAAKDAWAEQYSQAQMALRKDVLDVVSSLNRALGVGYSVVRQLPVSPDRGEACRRAKAWFGGPLSDGVYLLRVTLRHDLGVEDDPHFERTRARLLGALDSARDDLARRLAAERTQAAGPTGPADPADPTGPTGPTGRS